MAVKFNSEYYSNKNAATHNAAFFVDEHVWKITGFNCFLSV